ncbi:LamG domain-containing protein [Amycolatopsis mediterranei]|uniref:LamG domain-containing protein n=1 Tax=Amycolatopsis mediterranei TaxID=33910 RepID=UPI00342AFF5B
MVAAVLSMPAAVAAPDLPSAQPDRVSALATAKVAKHQVEALDQRTERREVFANPNGTLTARISVEPQRVRQGANWVPVDTRLRFLPEGSVAPVAVVTPLAFSGGGTGPVIRFGGDKQQIAFSWPGALPKPVLNGDTATYPEVLPGVDLQVKAYSDRFTHDLVVKTPQAAKNPALRTVQFGMHTTGLKVRTEPSGGLSATSPLGDVVFQAPPPVMRDSTGDSRVPAKSALLGVHVQPDSLALTTDQSLFDDPATRYPVKVDPGWEAGKSGWAEVYLAPSDFVGNSYWGGDGDNAAKVGFTNWSSSDTVQVHSYFQFNIGDFLGHNGNPNSDVLSAEFNVLETWAPSCSATKVDLFETGPISAANPPRGNAQPAQGALNDAPSAAHGYVDSNGVLRCADDYVGFNVKQVMGDALSRNSDTATLMMRADDESVETGKYSWKKFNPDTARLDVTYNWLPYAPTGLSYGPATHPCSNFPDQGYVPTATPTLRVANLTDPDGGPVQANFDYWVHGGSNPVGNTVTVAQESGSPFTFTVPKGAYKDGDVIAWRVQGVNDLGGGHLDTGPWSVWCDLQVDTTAPNKPAGITSPDYPANTAAGAPGKTGKFTFTNGGVGDVGSYRYSIGGDTPVTVQAGADGNATTSITPLKPGPTDISVLSVDRAGNVSPQPTLYHINVSTDPTATKPIGWWKLDGTSPSTTVTDDSGNGHPASFDPAQSNWTPGRVGGAVSFHGATAWASTTGGPVLDTSGSFSVSAWVRMDNNLDAPQTVVSEDGNGVSAFFLGYHPSHHAWEFSLTQKDDTVGVPVDTVWGGTPVLGSWTNLIGTYDAATGIARLYVDGRLAGQGTHTSTWKATGNLQIGRGMWTTILANHLLGTIDDVRVYNRVLGNGVQDQTQWTLLDSDIHTLATVPSLDHDWVPAASTSVTDAVGGLTATAVNGATVSNGTIRFPDPLNGSVTTAAQGVRTDASLTVSAKVELDQIDGTSRIATTQLGTHVGGFYLGYDGTLRQWVFTVPKSDVDNAALSDVHAQAGPVAGRVTTLTGVYDLPAQQLSIYVDGVLSGSTQLAHPAGQNNLAGWQATGGVQFGTAQLNSQPLSLRWTGGSIGEVRLYSGVLAAIDVCRIACP